MKEHTITITFEGICTSFVNSVPGIPLRVVLPNCMNLRMGGFEAVGLDALTTYTLPPHFAYIYTQADSVINAPGIVDSWIVAGVRLQVANATDDALTYVGQQPNTLPAIPDVPHLTDFAHRYRASADVIYGGRAMAYFDIFRGSVNSVQNDQAWQTIVTMKTEGAPRLQVTLIDDRDDPFTPPQVQDVEVGRTLCVGNSGGPDLDTDLDFLWHLSTDQLGIPDVLPRAPLGFEGGNLPMAELVQKLPGLADFATSVKSRPHPVEMFNGMLSCSTSQVP